MTLPTAKQFAYQARFIDTNDNARIKHLTEAVYTLVQVVEELEGTIRRIKNTPHELHQHQ
jgi:hypothetical protein